MADNHYNYPSRYQATERQEERRVTEQGRAADAKAHTEAAWNDYRNGRAGYVETFRRTMYGEYYDRYRHLWR